MSARVRVTRERHDVRYLGYEHASDRDTADFRERQAQLLGRLHHDVLVDVFNVYWRAERDDTDEQMIDLIMLEFARRHAPVLARRHAPVLA